MFTLNKKFLLMTLTVTILTTGCANRPESIASSYISHERYIDGSCAVLTTQMADARANLAKFSEMQNSKATEDAWGVFLLAVPFSKLSGDSEADVAKYKGMIEAIETAQIKNKYKGA
jgi:hypothetical protein